MALDTVWIAIASILSVYNISKAVDDRGNVITPEVKLNPGTIWQVALVVPVCSKISCLSGIATLRRSNVVSSQDPGLP
jgi:hypothetical protein